VRRVGICLQTEIEYALRRLVISVSDVQAYKTHAVFAVCTYINDDCNLFSVGIVCQCAEDIHYSSRNYVHTYMLMLMHMYMHMCAWWCGISGICFGYISMALSAIALSMALSAHVSRECPGRCQLRGDIGWSRPQGTPAIHAIYAINTYPIPTHPIYARPCYDMTASFISSNGIGLVRQSVHILWNLNSEIILIFPAVLYCIVLWYCDVVMLFRICVVLLQIVLKLLSVICYLLSVICFADCGEDHSVPPAGHFTVHGYPHGENNLPAGPAEARAYTNSIWWDSFVDVEIIDTHRQTDRQLCTGLQGCRGVYVICYMLWIQISISIGRSIY
jgi:hypothetical protein